MSKKNRPMRQDVPAAPVQREAAAPRKGLLKEPLARCFFYLFPILLFLSITVLTRKGSVCVAAVCLLFTIGREPLRRLRDSFTPLAAAVILYTGVCLFSGLWSHFGAYAANESSKQIMALALFLLVLARFPKARLRRLFQAVSAVLSAVSLLCIDGASLKLLTRGFIWVMNRLGTGYLAEEMGYESGIRITGIYNNPNIAAGMIAFGLLVSLFLYRTARSERARGLYAVSLGIQALAFFLSFSMGAMAAFAVTCLVYVLTSGREERLGLFLLMLECIVVTMLCSFAAVPFLGASGPASAVPVLLAPVCGLLSWALDRFVGSRILSVLEGRKKAVIAVFGGLAVLLAIYLVLAFRLTGPVTLTAGEELSRAVESAPGSYTVTAEGTEAGVQIYSQNEAQLMMHTNTVLYEGPLSGAAFTVPEDSKIVWFVLSGEGVLERVTLSDGTALPLGYKLLPSFAANRLQGLWANQNFIQRLVFFRDGITLWKQSPIYGWGAGGVEGQITAVQQFYYQSKYVHNHFIQMLDEAGIIGFVTFLALLAAAVWGLIRQRKQGGPLLPMLAACLTMMTAHSLTEVVWSARMYLGIVYVLLGAMAVWTAREDGRRAVGWASAGAGWGLVVVFSILQICSFAAAAQHLKVATMPSLPDDLLERLERMDALEVYDDTEYKANLMLNSLQVGDLNTAGRCARELLAKQEYEACYNAAGYYYLPLKNVDGFFSAMKTGILQEASDTMSWNTMFYVFRQAHRQLGPEQMADYVRNIAEMGDFLEDFNQGRMEVIVLEPENQAFLDEARALHRDGVTGQEAYDAMAEYLALE